MFPWVVLIAVADVKLDPTQSKPVAMVLGTYHMNNPGLDAVKVAQRDTLSSSRQKEIADLIDRLQKFRPNKILVEAEPSRQPVLDQRYRDFLAGTLTLSASEVEQVGFRLANRNGLKGLIGVDFKAEMDFNKVLGFAAQNGMGDFTQRVGKVFQEIGVAMSELDQKHSVAEILAVHNDPALSMQGHALYLDFLAVGKGNEQPGADMVAGWYRRNLVIAERIRANLQPGDRALVIFGSGHAYLLNQFLRESGKVTLEAAQKYLPKPPPFRWPKF